MDVIRETAADEHEELLNRDLASAQVSGIRMQEQFPGKSFQGSSPGDPGLNFSQSPNAQQKIQKGAAIAKMRLIAQEIYESTKGIADEIPRHSSKILQNVKQDKKNKGGVSTEPIKYTKYEAWEKMYRDKLEEYKEAKRRTEELTNRLHEKNEMYITREETYNAVIDELL